MTTTQVLQLNIIIPSILSPNPSQEHVREFVYLCRNVALAYLQSKVHRGRLDPNHFGVALEDLALDCIAPLFERNAHNSFVEIRSYYGTVTTASLTSEELLGLTRRLVFSKVNEELFRLYKENDHSLSNIIRNIKNALKFSSTLVPAVRNNEVWIQLLRSVPGREGLPIFPSEILEARVLAQLDSRTDLRHILDLVADILSDQDLYQKQYPLVGLAVIIRSLLTRSSWTSTDVDDHTPEISQEEICQFIASSILRTKTIMMHTYVGKGKLDADTFDLYFDCINEILEAEYILNDGMDLTYYDIMRKRLGAMSIAEYRAKHRVYLEYLSKLTRSNFIDSVRKELLLQ